MRRVGTFGCACQERRARPVQMGGWLTDVLNVAGSFVGDPGAGNQIASQSPAAFGPITQTPAEIATTVLPDAQAALANTSTIKPSSITSASASVATAILPQAVQTLSAAGYVFPAGSYGASLQNPEAGALDAFGGQYAGLVLVGGLGLAALLLFKEL